MAKSSNQKVVPESKQALDNMKYEVAQTLGVNMTKGYNGNLTAKENGRVGGEMVNLIYPVRTSVFKRNPSGLPMIARYNWRVSL